VTLAIVGTNSRSTVSRGVDLSGTAGQAGHDLDAVGYHLPVMVQETMDGLSPRDGGMYLDATVGEGGHALAILDRSDPGGRVIGIDRDSRSLVRAVERLSSAGHRFVPVQGNYSQMAGICQSNGISQTDGVLMDLGFSSRHIETPGYGFSFQRDEPLDMRYDPLQYLTAAEIINTYEQEELASLVFRFGEEPRSRSIAREIIRSRPMSTTGELAQAVVRAMGPGRRQIHPATKTFQALRIAVNEELEHLDTGLAQAIDLLASGGNLVVISYHSLEDRIVKTTLAREAAGCVCPPGLPVCVCGHEPRMRIITRRVVKPSPDEVRQNPRSRSARMRVAQRL